MKSNLIIGIVIAFIIVAALRGAIPEYLKKRRMAALTLEQKLALLAECGFAIAKPFTMESLIQSWDRAEFSKGGFDMVFVALGISEEVAPWRNHCVNLWHFDTECIEDHGDYKRIAERLAEMSQGALPITNVQDYVDVENGQAWLSFDLNGQPVRIDCEVLDDWVDPSIFDKFNDLLKQCDPSKAFVYYHLGGQDCVIACTTRENIERLKDHGIKLKGTFT